MNILPLKAGESFIALGDWNVDINEKEEGSLILKSLVRLFHFHYANETRAPTFRQMDIFQDSKLLHLDYILLSNDNRVKRDGVFSPKLREKEKLVCYLVQEN